MEGNRLLRSLTLRNVLSFGPEARTLEFEPLNVLIGPNGSGKSNLIEILGLLRSLPVGFPAGTVELAAFSHFGRRGSGVGTRLEIESTWNDGGNLHDLRHRIVIKPHLVSGVRGGAVIVEELIEFIHSQIPEYKFNLTYGRDIAGPHLLDHKAKETVEMDKNQLATNLSILSQLREPVRYPSLASLGNWLAGIRLYRDWVFGRSSKAREMQHSSLSDNFLTEDASNLSLILKRLESDEMSWGKLLEALRSIYDGIDKVEILELGEYVQIGIEENQKRLISADQLSDGTLRYLSLLAILCDPNPAPLICIEEPELGLHPDIIPTIARLLIDASQRTQLIVTTHSADLISALWEYPESVVVCERGFDGTTLNRLEPKKLKKWLKDYSLGHLWSMGELGGNRW